MYTSMWTGGRVTMNKWFVGSVLVAALVWAIPHGAAGAVANSPYVSEANYIESAFRATGATGSSYLIHNWTEVNHDFVAQTQLQDWSRILTKELGIQNAKILSHSDSYEHFLEVYGGWPGQATVSVTLSSLKFPNSPSLTIAVVRAERTDGDIRRLSAELNQVGQAVTKMQWSPQISACIEGFTGARMSAAQADEAVRAAFQAVGASRVEGVTANGLTSISGYSPQVPGYILTNGRKMNLQVAVHYDEYHRRTNVLVGTPIITKTY